MFGLSGFVVVAWFGFWVCWWSRVGGVLLQGVLVNSLISWSFGGLAKKMDSRAVMNGAYGQTEYGSITPACLYSIMT